MNVVFTVFKKNQILFYDENNRPLSMWLSLRYASNLAWQKWKIHPCWRFASDDKTVLWLQEGWKKHLKVLDLFSGIGGFSLGLERAGMSTIAFCEINTYCRKILNRHWPDVPVFDDIRKLSAKQLTGATDTTNNWFGNYDYRKQWTLLIKWPITDRA